MVLAPSLDAQKEVKPRPSQKAAVTQRIGIDTDITISYSRPGVRGRAIWGELVPYGLAKGDHYSNMEPYPWRGGANECTTIEFSRDVRVNGMKLSAGKYSLHFIPSQKTWIVIFNRNNTLWGSYKYKESEDALRVKVTPVKAPFQEWLLYGFDEIGDFAATAFLHWAELKVPFRFECQ
jgi:hypothetical protein